MKISAIFLILFGVLPVVILGLYAFSNKDPFLLSGVIVAVLITSLMAVGIIGLNILKHEVWVQRCLLAILILDILIPLAIIGMAVVGHFRTR